MPSPLPDEAARWEDVQSIFHAVAARPPHERAQTLAAACGDNETLHCAVQRLLDADAADSVLDRTTSDVAIDLFDGAGAEERVGTTLGPYRLTATIGEGGSGVVYLAERDDIGNVVAIKVLRDAWVSPSRRARFVDEQRTLAKLTHPGIARILDAGVEHGTPWFAMEYVQGLALDEHCRRHLPHVVDRVRLLLKATDAVQYAHERLFVHRDLKPTNILVLPDGTSKLLDFGIAQHLERLQPPDDAAAPVRVLSREYAAPEEVRGQPSGVQADVYSLGVILRQLVDAASAGPRRDDVDLACLCRTATATETTTRYASVEAFRRDLLAFVLRRPLSVRPPSWWYRTRLWAARHRRSLAAALVLGVILAALAGVYARDLSRAREATRAESERATRLLRFVTGLFEGDGGESATADLRVEAMLRRGVEEAEGLSSDPDVQADLRQTLGRMFHEVGDFPQADVLLTAALTHRRLRAEPRPADLVNGLVDLGELRLDQARLDDADRLVTEALSLADRRLTTGHPRRLQAQVLQGRLRRDQGKYAEAVTLLSDAVRRHDATPANAVELAGVLLALAETQFYAGDLTAATLANDRALQISRQVEGERHPDVGHALLNRAAIAAARQDLRGAERADREALDIFAKWYGETHPETASAMTTLAQAVSAQGRNDEALALLRPALRVQERTFGARHPRTAFVQNEIGMVSFRIADLAAAAVAFASAADGYGAPSGRHFQQAVSVANLGSVYLAQGDHRRAEETFKQALGIYGAVLPADHLNVAIARSKLGRALLRQGRLADAGPHLRAAEPVLAAQPGQPSSWLIAVREDLATLSAPSAAAR